MYIIGIVERMVKMKDKNNSVNIDNIVKDMEGKTIDIQEKKINYMQFIMFVGSILELIACFLPMFKAEAFGISASTSFIKGDGIYAIALLIGICCFTYLNKHLFTLGLSIMNIALLIIDCFFSGDEFVHLTFGGYVLFIAGLIILVDAILIYMNSKNA